MRGQSEGSEGRNSCRTEYTNHLHRTLRTWPPPKFATDQLGNAPATLKWVSHTTCNPDPDSFRAINRPAGFFPSATSGYNSLSNPSSADNRPHRSTELRGGKSDGSWRFAGSESGRT